MSKVFTGGSARPPLSAPLVVGWGHGPRVACCSTHSPQAVEGYRTAGVQRGPGSWGGAISRSGIGCACVFMGLLTYMAGALFGIYHTSIKSFSKGHRNPISVTSAEAGEGTPGNGTPTPKWKQWRGAHQEEDKRKGLRLREGCSHGRQCPHATKKKSPMSLTSSRKGALKSKQKLVIVFFLLLL